MPDSNNQQSLTIKILLLHRAGLWIIEKRKQTIITVYRVSIARAQLKRSVDFYSWQESSASYKL